VCGVADLGGKSPATLWGTGYSIGERASIAQSVLPLAPTDCSRRDLSNGMRHGQDACGTVALTDSCGPTSVCQCHCSASRRATSIAGLMTMLSHADFKLKLGLNNNWRKRVAAFALRINFIHTAVHEQPKLNPLTLHSHAHSPNGILNRSSAFSCVKFIQRQQLPKHD
jgi:hypothetical protein